ncbi:MAG: helix-turn-helix domain-containing protein [Candidatus Sulfopaludibacter sp.]|nr:helix-turn-helix domain-containing protein [Candidatus Sulfopaludibacter sp.]
MAETQPIRSVTRNPRQAHGGRTQLSDAIRAIRNRMGLSQMEFAILNHLHMNLISKYEQGRVVPNAGRLINLLRLAQNPTERQPFIAALNAHGILASDLSLALAGSMDSISRQQMASVSPDIDQSAISEEGLSSDKGSA